MYFVTLLVALGGSHRCLKQPSNLKAVLIAAKPRARDIDRSQPKVIVAINKPLLPSVLVNQSIYHSSNSVCSKELLFQRTSHKLKNVSVWGAKHITKWLLLLTATSLQERSRSSNSICILGVRGARGMCSSQKKQYWASLDMNFKNFNF
jgi:hypothetical protein